MKKMFTLVVILIGLASILIPNYPALGYPVAELPEDNLIQNPWFRSETHPKSAGLDGWTNVLVDGVGWGVSQKAGNPTPDVIVSGTCGPEESFCGTAARWANSSMDGDTESWPGLDVYLYQVVEADPVNRKLLFSMYWVNHRIDIAEVTVSGSFSVEGPWEDLWTPVSITQNVPTPACCMPGHNGIPWYETGILDTTLEAGFPYYRVMFHARYPESDTLQGDVGVKVTGVYFTSQFSEDPPSPSTPVAIDNPTAVPPGGPPTEIPTRPPRATPIPPSPTPTEAFLTSTPDGTETPSPTPTEVLPTETPTPKPTKTMPTKAPTNTQAPTNTPTVGPTATPKSRP